jgi:hypothetical protein
MYRYSEAKWLDPSTTELMLETTIGPIPALTYCEELQAASFRPVWTLAGVLAIQFALVALAVWLG